MLNYPLLYFVHETPAIYGGDEYGGWEWGRVSLISGYAGRSSEKVFSKTLTRYATFDIFEAEKSSPYFFNKAKENWIGTWLPL
jgi:hypothetical protein